MVCAVCGESFATRLESDPTRQLWALPSLENAGYVGEVVAFERPRQTT